ncbi:uncharacterized protein LOC144167732 isoform X1 [Haemaphysalis longicornis]
MPRYEVLFRWLLLGAAACPSAALIGDGEDRTTTIFLTSSGGSSVVASPSKRPTTTVGQVTTRGPRQAVGSSRFASCKSRRGTLPDMEPLEVLSSLRSPVQCLAACLLRSPRCRAFSFGNHSCDLLQRSPCESPRPLRSAPGFAHYDVLTRDQLLLTKGEAPPDCGALAAPSGDASTTQQSTEPTEATTVGGTKPGHGTHNRAGGDAVKGSTLHDVTTGGSDLATPLATDNAVGTQAPRDVTSSVQEHRGVFVYRRGPTTFLAALRACSEEGMVMAMPVSAEDHKMLVGLMRRNKAQRLWIGVQRTMSGNTTFMNGEQVPEASRRWGKGQPNNSGGTQICVEMLESLSHLWNDYDCENRAAYACQELSGVPRTSTQSAKLRP